MRPFTSERRGRDRHPGAPLARAVGALALALAAPPVSADNARYDEDPIRYSSAPVDDPVARLEARIGRGAVALAPDRRTGYLAALLEALDVPRSSQTLVFSKTSLQREAISPSAPRALYFNDDVYVGFVKGGEVLEIAAVDPRQGTIFYTLSQREERRPRLRRMTHECLQCHDSSSMTGGVPGLVMRSVFPDRAGQPLLEGGTFVTDDRSPFAERWGGWYVTGAPAGLRHMGNATARRGEGTVELDRAAAGAAALEGRFDPTAYLAPGSDVVALLVLGHQTRVHNLMTRAGFEARLALRDEAALALALGEPAGREGEREATKRRIRGAAEPLVEALLFSGEAPLDRPISDASSFGRAYVARGPRDARGRSLRELDLRRRLLRHPLSPLVYSAAFDGLPAPVRLYVYRRLWEVLSGADRRRPFAHLSDGDRRAILEILLETKRGLPPFFQARRAPSG